MRSNCRHVSPSLSSKFRHRLYDAGLALSGLGPAKEHYRAIVAGNIAELAVQFQRSILHHAVSKVPYYQHLNLPDDSLEAFPILSKASLRRHRHQLMSQALKSGDTVRISSGGSTGEPATVLMDQNTLQWDVAATDYYHYVLLGIDPETYFGKRKVALWDPNSRIPGRATDFRLRIGRLVSRTTYLNPCVISETILGMYAQQINRLRPAFITAYASSLYELAQFALRKGIRIHRPLMIFTGGDTLFPTMRCCIEQVFGCRIYDTYGSREAGYVTGECSSGRLHVLSFNNSVEVIDDHGEPVAAGQEGRLLVTSLHNYAMPLIRYETGDLATAGSGVCDCGSPLPFLNHIAGRVVEHFPTRKGSLVTGGYFFHLFYGCDWISEFHMLQEDLDRVVVSYTRNHCGQHRGEDMERIANGIRHAMGDDCIVEWQEVDCIPRTQHGKRLFTRSLVWEARHAELLRDIATDEIVP